MANPSLQIGNSNWAIKEDNLLGYSTAGTRFVPQPITMTRASAGTRVNSSGLVETVELLGSEEVTDGNFPLPNTNWILGGGNPPTIGTNDVAINSVDNNSFIQQSGILTSGKYYKITYDVISASATSNVLKLASSFGLGSIPTSVGTQIVYGTAITSTLYIERYTNGVNATITNVSVKESTKNNLARVDYDGTASSLLAEPQRTNLITYSEDFENSYYNLNNNVTATNDSTTSPSGLVNASKILGGLDNAYIGIFQAYTTTSTTVTTSVFLKQDTISDVGLWYTGDLGDSGNDNLDIDLSSGTLTSIGSGLTASITPYNNGWYKVTSTYTTKASGSTLGIRLYSLTAGSFYAWGLQLEVGSYATSYIPTSGGTVTRVQDQYSKTGISNLINSEEGVLFVEIAALSDDLTIREISLSDGTNTNRVEIRYANSVNKIQAVIRSSGGAVVLQTSTPPTITNFNKIAFKYKSGDFALWINGVEVATNTTSFSTSGLNRLALDNGSGGENFYGKVKQLQVFKTALTDSELATLTT